MPGGSSPAGPGRPGSPGGRSRSTRGRAAGVEAQHRQARQGRQPGRRLASRWLSIMPPCVGSGCRQISVATGSASAGRASSPVSRKPSPVCRVTGVRSAGSTVPALMPVTGSLSAARPARGAAGSPSRWCASACAPPPRGRWPSGPRRRARPPRAASRARSPGHIPGSGKPWPIPRPGSAGRPSPRPAMIPRARARAQDQGGRSGHGGSGAGSRLSRLRLATQ